MDPTYATMSLGGSLSIFIVTLAWVLKWRHYSRYASVFFGKSYRTEKKTAIRIFFWVCLVGSLYGVYDVVRRFDFTLTDFGWACVYALMISSAFFGLDLVVWWITNKRD